MYELLGEHIVETSTGEIVSAKYDHYNCPEDYEEDGVLAIEPMTAKEYLNEEELEEMLTSEDFMAEEKLDGVRETFHIREEGNRLFSRNIVKKTGWYAENSDGLPHLRDLEVPKDLVGTVLDGELRMNNYEFKEVSSSLNCLWHECIIRQIALGQYITLHVFDIIWYKGVYIAKMPLHRRKYYLEKVCKEINSPYIHFVPYTYNKMEVEITRPMLMKYSKGQYSAYPNLSKVIAEHKDSKLNPFTIDVDKRTWFEYMCVTGGEGIMLKNKYGTYKHTRGREYTKLKKYGTWDVVILDYVPPTKEYTGKEIETWQYWEGDIPITKHYAMNWIGTVKYGVLINKEEFEKWEKDNPKEKPELIVTTLGTFLVVGEASGFDEETREYITQNKEDLLGTVMEVKANDIMKTGKLRHPRYVRLRDDKQAYQCIWKDHMRL